MSKSWSRPPFPFHNILRSQHNSAEPAPNMPPNPAPSQTSSTPMPSSSPSHTPPPPVPLDDPMGEGERDPGYQADTEIPRTFVDPRQGFKHASTARKPKSYQQKLLHAVVRAYLVSKGLLPQDDDDESNTTAKTPGPLPSLPPSPDPITVGAYLAFQHNGPNIEHLLICWRFPMTHLWNAKAIQLLIVGFEAYVQDKQLVKLVELLGAKTTSGDIGKQLDDICNIQELIHQKLTSCRSALRSVLRQVEILTATMNAAEISATLQEKDLQSSCRSRRKERKKLKFLRRDDIIENAILLPKNQDADNAKRWNDIKTFFSHFGVADMSTDESETEATFSKPKTLRRVRKYWLSPAASNVLHYVDSQYSSQKLSGALKRGAAPLVRVHLAKKVNRTDTPTSKMPLNFYGPDISPVALDVLAPGLPVFIPVVPIVQQQDDQVNVE